MMTIVWFVASQGRFMDKQVKLQHYKTMLYHSNLAQIITPEPCISPILCHGSNSNSNPSSTPNSPSKAKPKHTSKLLESLAQLLQTVFHGNKAISYFCLHVILNLNTNKALSQTQASFQPLTFFFSQSSTCRISVIAVLFYRSYIFCAFTCIQHKNQQVQ